MSEGEPMVRNDSRRLDGSAPALLSIGVMAAERNEEKTAESIQRTIQPITKRSQIGSP